jgi:hypothetical protein
MPPRKRYCGLCKPWHMGILTQGESVHTLQSLIKLIYQPCSRTRAAWILFEIDGSMEGLGYDKS